MRFLTSKIFTASFLPLALEALLLSFYEYTS